MEKRTNLDKLNNLLKKAKEEIQKAETLYAQWKKEER